MKTAGSFTFIVIIETGGSLKIPRIAQHTRAPQTIEALVSSLICSQKGEPQYFFTSKEEI
jgi:hypothetical protein